MPLSKVVLVVGPEGAGKSCLLRRILKGDFSDEIAPTIGLEPLAERLILDPVRDHDILPLETQAVLPPEGVELEFWEIGGRERCRQLPRGRLPDGILLCYNTHDRGSFHAVSHMLMHYRMEHHLANNGSKLIARPTPGPRLAGVLCATMADDPHVHPSVLVREANDFVNSNGLYLAVTTSSLTGEGVNTALCALVQAMMEADEEAEAERIVAHTGVEADALWALSLEGRREPAGDVGAMTKPRGLRPQEPPCRQPPHPALVEVFHPDGKISYGARPLASCLSLGLWHRSVHVWICDLRTGGLLLRRYSANWAKHASRWGPSCHSEIRCYDQDPAAVVRGVVASESSEKAAGRALFEQMGVERNVQIENLWFSGPSRNGTCCELLDVYAIPIEHGASPMVSLQLDEDVQWVHYLDVFGSEGASSRTLQYFEECYRTAMIQRMKARIVHEGMQLDGALT